MLLFPLIFILEMISCNVLLQPNVNTDVSIASILLFAINSVIILILLLLTPKMESDGKSVGGILIFSFIIRVFLIIWDIYARNIFILPNSEADAVWYHQIAISFAFGGRSSLVDLTDYSFYTGQIYKMIGVQQITIQFLNVFFAIYSALLIYKILCNLEIQPKIRVAAMALVCFLPNTLVVTSIYLQESVIAFGIILSLYFYTLWWTERRSAWFFAALVPSMLVSFLHLGGMVAAIGFVATYVFVGNNERKIHFNQRRVFIGVALAFVFLVLLVDQGDVFFRKIGGDVSADSIVSSAGPEDTITDADYFIGISGLPSWLDLIVNSPIRVFYFVASPLPWMWRGLSDIIAFFGSALFYVYTSVISIRLFFSKRKKEKPPEIWAFLFVLLCIWAVASVMFGWGVSNTGTALRHREKFTYVCVLLYAVSMECRYRMGDLKWLKKESP